MSITHPEPEVRQLAQAALDDDDVERIVLAVCRGNGCANVAELFERNPDALFELHEEIMLMAEQLQPEPDFAGELDLALPDPDAFGFSEASATPMENM